MHSNEFIELVKILINTYDPKLLEEHKESINKLLSKFDKNIVEKLLFEEENGIVVINSRTLKFLRENEFDMKDISFDNVKVSGNNYSGLKNTYINIDKVYDKDIRNTNLCGVRLTGSLDKAIISGANFNGYIGNLVLNPQKVRNKDLSITNLSGVTIDGIFDGCDIFSTNFEGALGGIYINPQKVKNKDLCHVNLSGVKLVGDNGKIASFKGCKIKSTSFKNAIGPIEINPQELDGSYIMYCNFYGVKFIGGFDNKTLLGNNFEGSKNAMIDLNKVKDARIVTVQDLKDVNYIPLKEESEPKRRGLSLFRRR